MSQRIDTYLTDQFSDGAVRFNAAGIRDLATSQWRVSLGAADQDFAVRVYFDGVLTDADSPKPVALVTANVAIRVMDEDGTQLGSVPFASWANQGTGLYTASAAGIVGAPTGIIVEVPMQASFTNPAVTGKTSIITDASASYPEETITVDWVAVSVLARMTGTGIEAGGGVSGPRMWP